MLFALIGLLILPPSEAWPGQLETTLGKLASGFSVSIEGEHAEGSGPQVSIRDGRLEMEPIAGARLEGRVSVAGSASIQFQAVLDSSGELFFAAGALMPAVRIQLRDPAVPADVREAVELLDSKDPAGAAAGLLHRRARVAEKPGRVEFRALRGKRSTTAYQGPDGLPRLLRVLRGAQPVTSLRLRQWSLGTRVNLRLPFPEASYRRASWTELQAMADSLAQAARAVREGAAQAGQSVTDALRGWLGGR